MFRLLWGGRRAAGRREISMVWTLWAGGWRGRREISMVLMVRAEGAEDFLMNRLVEEAGVKVKSCNFAAE